MQQQVGTFWRPRRQQRCQCQRHLTMPFSWPTDPPWHRSGAAVPTLGGGPRKVVFMVPARHKQSRDPRVIQPSARKAIPEAGTFPPSLVFPTNLCMCPPAHGARPTLPHSLLFHGSMQRLLLTRFDMTYPHSLMQDFAPVPPPDAASCKGQQFKKKVVDSTLKRGDLTIRSASGLALFVHLAYVSCHGAFITGHVHARAHARMHARHTCTCKSPFTWAIEDCAPHSSTCHTHRTPP